MTIQVEFKKPANKLNLRKRYQALSSRESIIAKKLKHNLIIVLFKLKFMNSIDNDDRLLITTFAKMLFFKYFSIVLQVAEECHLENGSVMTGEEILLRGLYELVTGETQSSNTEHVFRREFTQQSRAFKFYKFAIRQFFAFSK